MIGKKKKSDTVERERVLAVHAVHVKAWNERNFETLAEVFHPDCLIFDGPSPVVEGWGAYRKRLDQHLGELDDFTIRSFDEMARVDERLDDRIAWIAARYEIKAKKDGQKIKEKGRWTGIYEKAHDTWRIVHFHISPDP